MALAALEAKIKAVWHQLDGEAKAELETLLADAKEKEGRFAPLVSQAVADVKAALKAEEPEAVAVLEKLEADAAALVGTAVKGL